MKPANKHLVHNQPLTRQFVVQWKTLFSFLAVVITIAASLSATAKSDRIAQEKAFTA
jgi:hypothetical protein